MEWRTPADESELGERLADAARRGMTVALTGGTREDALRPRADGGNVEALALRAPPLGRLIALEPADQTVTVGAGMPLTEVVARLAEANQWLPVAVGREEGTAGGLVAAGGPVPLEPGFGGVRRHLLACRTLDHRGRTLRWGRRVVKDVAGYDIKGLWCGSRGRLGALVEITFRTWSRPEVRRSYRARAGVGPAAELATAPAPDRIRPDGLSWAWHPDGAAGGELRVWLTGTEASVDERASALESWADARRLELEEAPFDPGGGSPREDTRAWIRLSVPPDRLEAAVGALRERLGEALERAEALPTASALRVRYRRGPEPTARAAAVSEAAGLAAPETPATVERGGPEEHAWCSARRVPEVRELEERVVEALGGRPRCWLADYV